MCQVADFRKRLLFLATALALPVALAGCAASGGGTPQNPRPVTSAPPGFSADTFSREGLISGGAATEAGCRALPDGLWAVAGSRRECIRYAAAGLERRGATALVYVPGDPEGASYRFAGGRAFVNQLSEHYELTAETRRGEAEALNGVTEGTPVILLARPGMHGSSGDHAQDRQTEAEVQLIGEALTQLRQRFGFRDFAAFGFSSGGVVVANLLARRADIRCAVIASAPLDLAEFYHSPREGVVPDIYALRGGLADPMRSVSSIRADATIFVIGDRGDRTVPASGWQHWAAAARRRSPNVYVAETTGFDRPELGGAATHHQTTSRGMEVAQACAAGEPAERVQRALLANEPLIVPSGRHLGGAEIRAAFVGHRMRGTEWFPRVDVSSYWGQNGALYHYDLRRPERRIAELRWWVEGDRLCTSRHGCGQVLSDGRFLQVVTGSPTRLSATFIVPSAGS
jgi:pimeloyl-ACP methyl ester carboxylesterase